MLDHARGELGVIRYEDWANPEVLAARMELHILTKEWTLVIGFGEQLASRHPELDAGWMGWAYALRELQRVAEVTAVLRYFRRRASQATRCPRRRRSGPVR